MANSKKRIPTNHIVGFLLSLVMTIVAAWAALQSDLPVMWIIIGIMALAVLQAGVQLFMFMHVTESASGNGHVPWNMMFHGFALAAIVVAGSLFTMSFGFSHDHGDNGGNEQHHEQHQEESGY
ncbi:cytochrome aa3 quinol oxidase subunit IV [Virgibacillus halodenitrificans]|jgi:cytochrome aa3-600 menaquinol oxidase subunit IV|uniref:Quinol oxidase subunit 4 n=1 Tax=Virgibacillus halodenitrificans TaxID=1482 RepID=A0AAC9IXP6_VIRHA|nr:cytochrome aa3 quinol oxidase subunit IV [Virgibacillus halodenitrificans]APC47194.1 cytochrome aa3 quinol oxidase subunit IV [Virgibacillus halodenitrificans]MBD1223637.1 cytochrome aa3 quinol oxidase subunit IV [Virgibacillus halodenitrificans]MCG1028015.1 cytochrome aa3 quinol oxidase subunit IV [Virgibacillus halodenitrificans]MCJ0931920.1 cytochrome aa3 quinol oxidase subunit IV [Virgibacillus halodenitrificans]MEC2159368.1 cytochrome aa3 quinol oxidase subunit IV [Virgibacillus halode